MALSYAHPKRKFYEWLCGVAEEHYFTTSIFDPEAFDPVTTSKAEYVERDVYVPEPNTPRLQAILLHEVGHLVANSDMPTHANTLEQEAEAWLWAIDQYAEPNSLIYQWGDEDQWDSEKNGREVMLWAINTYWWSKQIAQFPADASGKWCDLMNRLDAEYDPVFNKWVASEDLAF